MTSITTNVKHRIRTTESEYQGQNSISDPDQNLGFTCIFSSGMQELTMWHLCQLMTQHASCLISHHCVCGLSLGPIQ